MAKAAAKPKEPRMTIKDLSARQADTERKMDTLLNLVTGLVEKLEPEDEPDETIQFQDPCADEQEAPASRTTRAIDTPALVNKYAETGESFTGGPGTAECDEAPDGSQFIKQSMYADVSSPAFKDWAANMAFANEKVSIIVHKTAVPFADKKIEVSVGGNPMVFERGKRYDGVPRYLVEGLMRAKPVTYGNEEYLDTDGKTKYRQPAERGLRYDFAIINPTARDQAWQQSIQAQP